MSGHVRVHSLRLEYMNDHSSEYLGSQKVQRSAYAEKTARATTIYLGTCKRDNRPVRFEFPANLGPAADVPCFICTLPVRCERLHAVTTTLTCDGSCRSAHGPACECGCGGINHGRTWGQGALLDQCEVVESAIAKYRAEQVKIKERREAKAVEPVCVLPQDLLPLLVGQVE